MSGIKPQSARYIFWVFAVLLVLLGTSLILTEQTTISKTIVLFAAAVILASEIGFNRLFNIGQQHDAVLVASAVLIVTLVVTAFIHLLPFSTPAFIASAGDYVVILSAIAVFVESF